MLAALLMLQLRVFRTRWGWNGEEDMWETDDCLEFPSCMIDTFSRKDLVSTHVIVVSISCLARCTLARVDTEDLIKTQR
jgi:hypothetical protein